MLIFILHPKTQWINAEEHTKSAGQYHSDHLYPLDVSVWCFGVASWKFLIIIFVIPPNALILSLRASNSSSDSSLIRSTYLLLRVISSFLQFLYDKLGSRCSQEWGWYENPGQYKFTISILTKIELLTNKKKMNRNCGRLLGHMLSHCDRTRIWNTIPIIGINRCHWRGHFPYNFTSADLCNYV